MSTEDEKKAEELKQFVKETVDKSTEEIVSEIGDQSEAIGYVYGTTLKEAANVLDDMGGALGEIQKNTRRTNNILVKFAGVFDSMNDSLATQSKIIGQLLGVNTEQIEIERRRDALASVSGAPSALPAPPVSGAPSQGPASGGTEKVGPSFMQGLLTNWLANLFSGGKGFGAALLPRGGIGGLVRKGAIAAIAAPWIGQFVEGILDTVLDGNFELDDETRKKLSDAGGDSVRNAMIGGMFSKRLAIVGALAPWIEAAGVELANKFGVDLNKEVLNFGGFSVTGNDAAAVGGAIGAAGLTYGGPALARGAMSLAMANPVAAAIAVGATAAAVGTKFARDNRANYNVQADEFSGDFTQDTNDFARGAWGMGWNKDAANDGGRLAKFSSQVDELAEDGITPEEHSNILGILTEALAKSNVDVQNPVLDPSMFSQSNAEAVAAILDQIGEKELAQKWRDQKIQNLLSADQQGVAAAHLNQRDMVAMQLSAAQKQYEKTGEPGDLNRVNQLQGQLDELDADSKLLGINTPARESSINPIMPTEARAERVSAVNDHGNKNGGWLGTIVNYFKGGDTVQATGAPININAPVNQSMNSNFSNMAWMNHVNPSSVSQ